MKVIYSQPARDEIYLVSKNEARRLARSHYPELERLAFQTMHGPKMSRELPYLATFAGAFVRILSIPPEFVTVDLKEKFKSQVLPYVFSLAKHYSDVGHHWPSVVVATGNEIHQVPCSDGCMFPSQEEVASKVKKRPQPICRLEANGTTA